MHEILRAQSSSKVRLKTGVSSSLIMLPFARIARSIVTASQISLDSIAKNGGVMGLARSFSTVGLARPKRSRARATDTLDFLDLPLSEAPAVSRHGKTFQLDRAWSVARFGRHTLKRGWWMVESESGDDINSIEVRLTSASNPLITIASDHNARKTGRVRIYLPKAEAFEVALLLSPWPGQISFSHLRLRRLRIAEVVVMASHGLKRLLKARNGFTKLIHAGRQILRGRPIGLRLEPAPVAQVTVGASGAQSVVNANDNPCRLVRHGDIDAFVGHDDTLDPRAIEIVSRHFALSKNLQAIYCDVLEGAVILPRPNRDAELGRWFEVAGPPLFFRHGVCADRLEPRRRLDAVVAKWGPRSVDRIPLPLVRRPKGHWPVLPPVPVPRLAHAPRVSVVIPTKYRIDLLQKCLEGLARRTGYPNLQVVLVDNGSTDERLPYVIDQARKWFDLIHVRDLGAFNFSRLVNLGVRASSGDVILLMNDDVEPTQSGWLHRMVESAMRRDVGAVGARLIYPDRTIQHAGVSMGIGGLCGHLWKGLGEQDAARTPYVVYPGERMAVTGACLAIRREVFDKAGAFDEVAFPVALNDIDFCLRVRALGFRNIYRGDAVLIHREGQSRGQDSETALGRRRAAKETETFLFRWRSMIHDDPFGSPAFDLRTESGAVHYGALSVAS